MQINMKEKKMNKKFMLFEESDHFFVFDGGNGELFEISHIYYDVIKYMQLFDIKNVKDIGELVTLLGKKYSKEQIEEVISEVNENPQFLYDTGHIYELFDKKIKETKNHNGLWLNISHDCNLNCKYCFGNGGDYGKQRILMSKKTAKKCIDMWYSQVDLGNQLLEINFFGGEPLMNSEVLIYCVDYINELFGENKKRVRYNLTTNGTIINEQILNLLKKNHFRVSISIDGIEKIHDLNRRYISGKGSFLDIVKNIKKFKEYLPKISAQITLTKEGIPYLTDAVTQLWDMGINRIRSNLVFSSTDNYTFEQYETYHNEIKKISMLTYQNLIEERSFTYQNLVNKLDAIRKKRFNVNCFFWGGGAMIFSPEGERFRCYRFMENDQYKLSSGENELSEEKPIIDKCSSCWAQLLCADGCVYENSVYSEDINEPAEEWCVKTKISLEEALKLYARLVINSPETFERILGR